MAYSSAVPLRSSPQEPPIRTKLAAAALVAGLAASFGPTTQASAICIGWYYAVTGQCSPCNTVGVVANVVKDNTGVEPIEMNCVA